MQIVAQLPENTEDALKVLEYARELVEGFLAGKPYQRRAPPEGPGDSKEASASSSSLRSLPDNVSVLPR